jgi:hypothetical protein
MRYIGAWLFRHLKEVVLLFMEREKKRLGGEEARSKLSELSKAIF